MAQKGHPTKLKTAERRKRAMELRLACKTYDQIGAELGISGKGAHKLVMTGLDAIRAKTAEDAARVRELELERIGAIVDGLWAKRGEPRAADTILRAMDRRARYLGLDAPLQVDATVAAAVSDDDQRAARIAALLDRAGARRAGQAAGGSVGVATEPGPADAGVPQLR